MKTYSRPGVYFEQQDAAVPVIAPLRSDIAGFVGIAERGPLHLPVKVESLAQFTNVFGGKLTQSYLAYAVDGFFANGGQTCWVVRVAVPRDAGTATLDLVDDFGSRILSVIAGSPGAWGNEIVARWIVRGDQVISLTMHYSDGSEQLVRDPLPQAQLGNQKLSALEKDSLPSSVQAPLVLLELPEDVPTSDNAVSIRALTAALAGGSDGLTNLQPVHMNGNGSPPDSPWGLAALEQVREVAIVAIPDIMPVLRIVLGFKPPPPPDCSELTPVLRPGNIPRADPEFPPGFTPDQVLSLQEDLINHCEKLHNRVAILDTPARLFPEQAALYRKSFQSGFGALYYPWILVDDPLRLTGLVRSVPPSGHIAGIYASSDRRRGVHKPPANEVVEGAVDLDFPVDDVVHGELNRAQVNVIRAFAGRGIRIAGARTLSDDILWRYVNVRRLLCMIEVGIAAGTQWTVFEPNNLLLQREMDRAVRGFLEALFRRGMLDGATADVAYTVRCDDSTNPPEEIDLGRVVCQVGVQPPLPAEFVVVVLGKTQNGIEVMGESGASQNA